MKMKKSARVTLTVLAAMACGYSQQAGDPCDPGSFNPQACNTAVRSHGFCDGSAWVAQQYEKYPYYYGRYQAYLAGGGVVTPASPGSCRGPVARGGFGAFGFLHHTGS
jgi:hypothetical protein